MGSKDRVRHEAKKPKKNVKKAVAPPAPTIVLTEHRGHAARDSDSNAPRT